MKKLKVLLSVLLSAMLVLSLLVPVMAEEETGSITISDAFNGKSYTIYRILDIESYVIDDEDEDNNKATYKPSSDLWKSFIEANSQYVSIDEQNYVTWVTGLVQGILFVLVVLLLVSALSSASFMQGTVEAIESSTLTKFIYEGNFIGKIIAALI